MKQTMTLLLVLILISCGSNAIYKSETKSKDWALLNFIKVDSLNPILEPQLHQIFQSPITNKQVHWEERNVLNPSAIVKDGKVYLIYRAQDKHMTSRLGLTISEDGQLFKKQPAPIFYPDNDTMKKFEWGRWC